LSIQESTTRTPPHRRWLVLGFSLAFTAATLYVVFRGINGRILRQLFATQDRRLLAAATFFILLQIIFGAERWRAILSTLMRGQAPSMLNVQAVFYASTFFNCLPLGTVGGDVARVWLARKFALSVRQLVLSVLVDRMFTVGALILIAALTLPNIAQPLAVIAWLVSLAILAGGAAGFLLLQPIERILGRWRGLRLVYLVLRTTEQVRDLTRRGGLLALSLALLSAMCGVVAAYCIARSLGIGVGPAPLAAVISMVTLVSALPVSFAGWGVREMSVVALLGLLGVDREAALLLSVEIGLLGMLMNLPGGVVWLTMKQGQDIVLPAK
jgi:uncharacterized membrane protein YbhN (UPF0104 family)